MSWFKKIMPLSANRALKGAWPAYDTLQMVQRICEQNGLIWTFTDNRAHSMGDWFSENTLALWDPNRFDEIELGCLVIAQAPNGVWLSHRIKAGSPERGWLMQGTYRLMPDNFRVTKDSYRGTFVGQFTAKEKVKTL